ncbi:hypothetical protein [Dankookia sp. P2]|uniref:hypothetical protein n=1 Tax=Dankookia sp. P2 TaxID=3423955 RepID=UPI003D666489
MLRRVRRRPGVLFKATCPNPQAVRRALAAREAGWGPEEISLLVSASEGHSRRNLKRSREEQWANAAEMAALGRDAFTMVGTISVAFDCPFDGRTPQERVLEDAERFATLGVTRIAIGDTIGSATPPRVRDLIGWLHGALPTATFIAHFHDSRGTGIANTLAAIEAGADPCRLRPRRHRRPSDKDRLWRGVYGQYLYRGPGDRAGRHGLRDGP